MDPSKRSLFNASYDAGRVAQMTSLIEARVGRVPFRVAETPLFLTSALRDSLVRCAREITAQLSTPERVRELKRAIPERFDAPGMDELPNTAQVDFALVQGEKGEIEGRLIEMQGFPSLFALMLLQGEVWAQVMKGMPGLDLPWSCWLQPSREATVDVLRRTIVAGNDPQEVALVDIDPKTQKTNSDFWATEQLLGVESVCITRVIREGKRLFREKDGKKIPIRRIYNRMVFDELEVKKVKVPFEWKDELDVTWCSHPNWYWTWSKYCLPFLAHPAVPPTRFLSEIERLPEDLQHYVLKPLFSFAGGGVVVDVTREAIDRIPKAERGRWVLMKKIEYAPVVKMPDGTGVKAEVRVMMARPPEEKSMTPVLCLVRLSRGKMIGVDFNKDLPWTGGSVGMWTA